VAGIFASDRIDHDEEVRAQADLLGILDIRFATVVTLGSGKRSTRAPSVGNKGREIRLRLRSSGDQELATSYANRP
jgi:hypothetical protein